MPHLCGTLAVLLRPSGLAALFVFILRSMLITSLSCILIGSDCRSLTHYSNQLDYCQIVNKKHIGYLQNYGGHHTIELVSFFLPITAFNPLHASLILPVLISSQLSLYAVFVPSLSYN